MVRIDISLKSKILLVILIQALCLGVISAQKKTTFDLKQEEYGKILDQNSNLKLDTVELSSNLSKLKVDNQELLKMSQQDSTQSKTLQDTKAELKHKEKDLTDSLSILKQVKEDLSIEIKSDSVIFVDLTAKKAKP
jgi:predicted nuclease with TOPRIM domain